MAQIKRLSFSYPTIDDINLLHERMREADRAELEASHGGDLRMLLAAAVHGSTKPAAIWLDGEELLCVFGVFRSTSAEALDIGSPWLITTHTVDRVPVLFWKLTKLMWKSTLREWDVLYNFIDSRHVQAVRWAERLGLPLERPTLYGVQSVPFHRFIVKGEKHVRTGSNNPGWGRDVSHRPTAGGKGQCPS